MPDAAARTVLLAGATGLVGRECLRQLLADPSVRRITAIVRRPLEAADPRLESRVVDFDRLAEADDAFRVDQVVCALGTTMKQAGSREAFRRVDEEYPLTMARLTHAHGARHFLHVSSLGADPDSRIFYSRVKGEVERALREVGFRSLTIVRPSILLGDRDELRPGERIGQWLGRFLPGRWRAVHARDVAATLVRLAAEDAPGVRVVESEEIRELGG